jgi:hypothetical protein
MVIAEMALLLLTQATMLSPMYRALVAALSPLVAFPQTSTTDKLRNQDQAMNMR